MRWVLPYTKEEICNCTKTQLQKCNEKYGISLSKAIDSFYTRAYIQEDRKNICASTSINLSKCTSYHGYSSNRIKLPKTEEYGNKGEDYGALSYITLSRAKDHSYTRISLQKAKDYFYTDNPVSYVNNEDSDLKTLLGCDQDTGKLLF